MKCPNCDYRFHVGGKKRPLTPDQIEEARGMRADGEKVEWIAFKLGGSKSFISKVTRDLSPKRKRRQE